MTTYAEAETAKSDTTLHLPRPHAPRELWLRFYSIAEVCERLGLSRWTIMDAIKSGELVAHKFGRTVRIREDHLPEAVKGFIDELPDAS